MGKERNPDSTAIRRENAPFYEPALQIRNDSPEDIYEAVVTLQNLFWDLYTEPWYEEKEHPIQDWQKRAYTLADTGIVIGKVFSDEPGNPIQQVRSRVQGSLVYADIIEDPVNQELWRGIGGEQREFNVNTVLELRSETTIDEEKISRLSFWLNCLGYESYKCDKKRSYLSSHGSRIAIVTSKGSKFELLVDRSTTATKTFKERYGLEFAKADYSDRKNHYLALLRLEFIRQAPIGPLPTSYIGVSNLSKREIIDLLEESRQLTEAVATGLSVILRGEKPSALDMEWLPPVGLRGQEGKVSKLQKVEGLERLLGLREETIDGLQKVRHMLEYPDKVFFLRDHGFKQSNGAVFWGIPGTGKTLAGKALAEETGCRREVLKLDEYLSSYIHKSAQQVGGRLRQIKSEAAVSQRPVIVQIDEADTILLNTGNIGSSGFRPDAEEIRGVLLREFEESSNVFYILTTNLDPRDPTKTDSAILRHQRIGIFVPFSLPDTKGRKEIFEGLMKSRQSVSLRWADVDLSLLSEITEDFTPADIEEVLTTAVSLAYDSGSKVVLVENEHFKKAARQVEEQKVYLLSLPPRRFD